MKILISLFITILLLTSGCETNLDPIHQDEKGLVSKPFVQENGSIKSVINYELIPLPVRSPIFFDSVFAITKNIVGEIGGQMILERTYLSNRGRLVTMLVDLVIPPHCFSGQRTITLKVERDFAIVNCTPEMEFKMPMHLVQTFTGLDLENYQTEEIDFVYINENGLIEDVDRTSLLVIKSLGVLSIIDAKLNHFSRYGWVRKSE
jgi:hypothetical protein